MDTAHYRAKLEGCYVTVPTPFLDEPGFGINEPALRRYVDFLIEGGLGAGTATFLAGGAAGDFSTMTFEERLQVASIVAEQVNGRVPLAFGAQSTSTLELVRLAKAAQGMNYDFIQVSCPFYFAHTEADFEEYVRAAAKAAPEVGIIVYNTFWTSSGVSFSMVERLAEIDNIVGLKWAAPRTDAFAARFIRFSSVSKWCRKSHSRRCLSRGSALVYCQKSSSCFWCVFSPSC